MDMKPREWGTVTVVAFGFGTLFGTALFGAPQLLCSLNWTALAAVGTVAAFFAAIWVHTRQVSEDRERRLSDLDHVAFGVSIRIHIDAIQWELRLHELDTLLGSHDRLSEIEEADLAAVIAEATAWPPSFEAVIDTIHSFKTISQPFHSLLFFSRGIHNHLASGRFKLSEAAGLQKPVGLMRGACIEIVDEIERFTGLRAMSVARYRLPGMSPPA